MRERKNIKLGELGGSLTRVGGGKMWSKYSVWEKKLIKKIKIPQNNPNQGGKRPIE